MCIYIYTLGENKKPTRAGLLFLRNFFSCIIEVFKYHRASSALLFAFCVVVQGKFKIASDLRACILAGPLLTLYYSRCAQTFSFPLLARSSSFCAAYTAQGFITRVCAYVAPAEEGDMCVYDREYKSFIPLYI